MDEEGLRPPQQFDLSPRRIVWIAAASVLLLVTLVFCFIAFTPIREVIPGYGTTEIRQRAVRNAVRLSQLEDSLEVQTAYIAQLRTLMTGGQIDTSTANVEFTAIVDEAADEPPVASAPSSDLQLGLDETVLPVPTVVGDASGVGRKYFEGVDLVAVPPVEGFVTRPLDSRIEHYGVDIAVPEGTLIRSMADGYVVFADWTHEGGYALAIQHAKGYLSVYKHNQRLLKRAGDRVRAQEPIARSGNTGEVTTGPHLHFELWQNGLAQDPRRYIVEW
ncbi:MAG: M23 family metallopeptidase [Bacteroidetes bacterium]|nr:M23 family metallopeptidase [Bacteroidota bacterium]